MSSMNPAQATNAATSATTTSESLNNSSNNNSCSGKTIILIRHAESEENRRLHSLMRCFGQLGRLSLPSYSDVTDSFQLLQVHSQVDSNVSDVGKKQIQHMQDKLSSTNFIETNKVQLVAHSPLERAKQTCEGMLGCIAPTPNNSNNDDENMKENGDSLNTTTTATTSTTATCIERVVELHELTEKTPSEWIPLNSGSLYRRIAALEAWLGAQPEPVIALVGHSQFFKAMLGLDFKFGNCEVWQVTFDGTTATTTSNAATTTTVTSSDVPNGEEPTPSWTLPPRWTNLKRLHSCDVSRANENAQQQQQGQ